MDGAGDPAGGDAGEALDAGALEQLHLGRGAARGNLQAGRGGGGAAGRGGGASRARGPGGRTRTAPGPRRRRRRGRRPRPPGPGRPRRGGRPAPRPAGTARPGTPGCSGGSRLATSPRSTQPTPRAASPSRCHTDSPRAASATGSTGGYSVPNRWRRSTRVVEVQSGVMRVEPRRSALPPRTRPRSCAGGRPRPAPGSRCRRRSPCRPPCRPAGRPGWPGRRRGAARAGTPSA